MVRVNFLHSRILELQVLFHLSQRTREEESSQARVMSVFPLTTFKAHSLAKCLKSYCHHIHNHDSNSNFSLKKKKKTETGSLYVALGYSGTM